MLKKDFLRKDAKAKSEICSSLMSSVPPLRLCSRYLHARRSLPIVLLLILATTVSVFPQKKNSKFDPDGSFWLLGQPPNDLLELSAINLNAKKLKRLPPPGLQITNGNNYPFKALSVKRNNFTFTTVARRGISYSFSGRFLKGGVFATTELNDESPIMEGTLTKYRGGQKVAEAKLQFTYFGGT